jgi:hypothetical protein
MPHSKGPAPHIPALQCTRTSRFSPKNCDSRVQNKQPTGLRGEGKKGGKPHPLCPPLRGVSISIHVSSKHLIECHTKTSQNLSSVPFTALFYHINIFFLKKKKEKRKNTNAYYRRRRFHSQ